MKNTYSIAIFLLLSIVLSNITKAQTTFNVLSLGNGAYIVKSPKSHATVPETSNDIIKWTKEAIIDGTTEKGWSTAENTEFPLEFIFELSEECVINKFGFNTECEPYKGISAKDLKIEISTTSASNGYNVVLEPQLMENAKTTYFTIPPTNARWIKVSILSNHGFPTHTELMEIEAYGYYAFADAKPINLTGNWESTWGTVSIRQEGSTINGCYEYRDGLITNAGMERRLLTYKWLEVGENGMGHAVLVVNEEGNRLNGIWGFGNDLNRYGIWTFKKMGESPTLCYLNEEKDVKEEDAKIERLNEEIKTTGKLIVYGINFETNSSEITSKSFPTLNDILSLLNKDENMRLKIAGHTDDIGSEENNLTLSENRAKSVVNYLVERGISQDRLTYEGLGEKVPIADNESQLGRAANRRVELILRQ